MFKRGTPDGHKLLSNSAPGGSHNSILVMNVDGTNRSVVFDDPNRNAVAPVWSPTGDRVAFGLGGYFQGSALPAQVAVVGRDGQGLRTLTPAGPGNYGFPSWSPDGKRLVLRAAEERSKGLAIIDYESVW